jgi:hypothetical protein
MNLVNACPVQNDKLSYLSIHHSLVANIGFDESGFSHISKNADLGSDMNWVAPECSCIVVLPERSQK